MCLWSVRLVEEGVGGWPLASKDRMQVVRIATGPRWSVRLRVFVGGLESSTGMGLLKESCIVAGV